MARRKRVLHSVNEELLDSLEHRPTPGSIVGAAKTVHVDNEVIFDRLNTGFTDGSIDIQEFKELKNPLIAGKAGLEQQLATVTAAGANRLAPVKNWILEANQAQTLGFGDNWLEMKSFLQKVGSHRLVRSQTLTVTFTNQWNLLAEAVVASRNAPDDFSRNQKWWTYRESHPGFGNANAASYY